MGTLNYRFVFLDPRFAEALRTTALFVVMLRWVGGRSWIVTLMTAILAVAGSYLLFARWLMVPLPSGTWLP